MKFREKDSTPGAYQTAYLFYLDELVPEVLETLKSLVPKYEKVFGVFGYGERIHLFNCLVANKITEGNYILHYLDPSVQNSKPDAPEPSPEENPILKNFLEFQQSFCHFIGQFYLEKDWLKSNLFSFLYELSTNPKKCGGLGMASGYSHSVYSGEPLEFTFDGWEIRKDSKDFEKAAVSAFKDYLRGYTQKTAKQAKADGYKLTTGKSNFESIKWLVHWTVQNWSMKEISAKYPVPRKANTPKKANAGSDFIRFERKLNAAFEKLEKEYDLPRRYKKHYKNL